MNVLMKKEMQGKTAELIQHMLRQLESSFLVPKAIQQNSDNYIFNPQNALKRFIKNLGYNASLEDVEEFNMLNPTREGQLKVGGTYDDLSSHDFRRSFAVFLFATALVLLLESSFSLNIKTSTWRATMPTMPYLRR